MTKTEDLLLNQGREQIKDKDLLTISEASQWAISYVKKNVTPSNISYLIQYGRVKKYGNDGVTKVSKQELIKYYRSFLGRREINWKAQLGDDINWALSFKFGKAFESTLIKLLLIPIL